MADQGSSRKKCNPEQFCIRFENIGKAHGHAVESILKTMTFEARGTVAVGGTVACMARVVDIETATNLTQSSVSSITYTVYLLNEATQTRTANADHTDVSCEIASTIYDVLQIDAGWDEDDNGFNFRHVIDISQHGAFETANATYVVEYTITPVGGQVILVPFRVVAV